VVFNIPAGFDVVDDYNGQETGNTVVWDLGEVDSLKSGTLQVKLKCTSLDDEEEVVTFKAVIKEENTTRDSSVLYNLVYENNSTGRHDKYIVGYPDGTFGPERSITRAELAAMLCRLFDLNSGSSNYNQYKDLSKKHWAYGSIVACSNEGLFGGYPDGTFKPDKVLTRAELAAILSRKLSVDNTVSIWIHFSDLNDHWAKNQVEQMYRQNIIKGYSDESVKPNKSITRAETVTMLNRFMFRGQQLSASIKFKDLSSNHWAYEEIAEAASNHSYERDNNGNEK
jgi:hypothetical protein